MHPLSTPDSQHAQWCYFISDMYLSCGLKTMGILISWLHQKPADQDTHCFQKGVYNLKKVICTVKLLCQIQQRKQLMKLSYIINTCTPRKVRLGKKAALTGTRPGSSWAFSSARIPKIYMSILLTPFCANSGFFLLT